MVLNLSNVPLEDAAYLTMREGLNCPPQCCSQLNKDIHRTKPHEELHDPYHKLSSHLSSGYPCLFDVASLFIKVSNDGVLCPHSQCFDEDTKTLPPHFDFHFFSNSMARSTTKFMESLPVHHYPNSANSSWSTFRRRVLWGQNIS